MLRVGRSIAGGHSSGCGCLGDHWLLRARASVDVRER